MAGMHDEVAIGIDLGTTNSCAAIVDAAEGRPKVLRNLEGMETTPSVVYFKDNEVVIGQPANDIGRVKSPENTVYEVKRMMGYLFNDEEMNIMRGRMPQNTFRFDEHSRVRIVVTRNGRQFMYTPEQISAMILSKIRDYASAALHMNVTAAVITVPAYFNEAQRAATRNAAELAGLKVLKLLNEPTAAAIAYGFHRFADRPLNVLVYDFGGGTLDVTLMKVEHGRFTTIATTGDSQLGGQDFDEAIMFYCLNFLKQQHDPTGVNRGVRDAIDNNHKVRQRLLHKCEHLKKLLSQCDEEELLLDSLFQGADFELSVTRLQFEQICGPLFDRCLAPVKECLMYAKMQPQLVDEIVMAGGSSRIPKVQAMLREYFQKEVRRNLDADNAIALGAAIIAAQCVRTLQTASSQASGTIPAAMPVPTAMPSLGLHTPPTQHTVHTGHSTNNIQVIDVVPLPLGLRTIEIKQVKSCFGLIRKLETNDQVFSEVIAAQTQYPCSFVREFRTCKDNQSSVSFEVFQGKGATINKLHFLGKFEVKNLPSRPAGKVVFNVEFAIDDNGCLAVRAFEKTMGVSVGGIKVQTLASDAAWTGNEMQEMRDEVKQALIKQQSNPPRLNPQPTPAPPAPQPSGGYPMVGSMLYVP